MGATATVAGLRATIPVGSLFCVLRGPTRGRPCSAAGIRVQLHTAAHAGGFDPVVTPAGAAPEWQREPPPTAANTAGDLPAEWRLVRELEGQSYAWPEVRDDYSRYRVFAASTREGTVHIAIGETVRPNAWGRDRPISSCS